MDKFEKLMKQAKDFEKKQRDTVLNKDNGLKKTKLLARYIADYCFRDRGDIISGDLSELELLHCGTTPSSKTGDFSDVKVVTPYGEIEWNKVSRISDKEMRKLMLDIEKRTIEFIIQNHSLFRNYYNIGISDTLEIKYKDGITYDNINHQK